jgi:hypothetical protein
MINHTKFRKLDVYIISRVIGLEGLETVLRDQDDGQDIGFFIEGADGVGRDGTGLDEFGDEPVGKVETHGR